MMISRSDDGRLYNYSEPLHEISQTVVVAVGKTDRMKTVKNARLMTVLSQNLAQ